MKIAGAKMNLKDKYVVLQYEEIKVKSYFEYDKKSDQIVGFHSQMQVVMARGFFSRWKQPIFFEFDQKITK